MTFHRIDAKNNKKSNILHIFPEKGTRVIFGSILNYFAKIYGRKKISIKSNKQYLIVLMIVLLITFYISTVNFKDVMNLILKKKYVKVILGSNFPPISPNIK